MKEDCPHTDLRYLGATRPAAQPVMKTTHIAFAASNGNDNLRLISAFRNWGNTLHAKQESRSVGQPHDERPNPRRLLPAEQGWKRGGGLRSVGVYRRPPDAATAAAATPAPPR